MSDAPRLQNRAAAMAERLATAALRAGVDDGGVAEILGAYEAAMRPRVELLADEHHIDYLHPGRTALILLEDIELREPRLIAAGALVESLHPELRSAGVEGVAAELAAMVPTPHSEGERLLEELVIATDEVRVIALAEWLDQVRRLHLREQSLWEPLHHLTTEVYLPVARRTEPTMARRFQWWCGTFQERFLNGWDDRVGAPCHLVPGSATSRRQTDR